MPRSYKRKIKLPKIAKPTQEDIDKAEEEGYARMWGRLETAIRAINSECERLLCREGLDSIGAVTKVLGSVTGTKIGSAVTMPKKSMIGTICIPNDYLDLARGYFWIKTANNIHYINPLDAEFWETNDGSSGLSSGGSNKGSAYNITQYYSSRYESNSLLKEPDWLSLTNRFQHSCYWFAYPEANPFKGIENDPPYDFRSPFNQLKGAHIKNGDMLAVAEYYGHATIPMTVTFYRFFREGVPFETGTNPTHFERQKWYPWVTTNEIRDSHGQITWTGTEEAQDIPDTTNYENPWNFGVHGDLYFNTVTGRFQIRLDTGTTAVWRWIPKFFYYSEPLEGDPPKRTYDPLKTPNTEPGDLMYDIELDAFLGRYANSDSSNDLWRPFGGGGTCWLDEPLSLPAPPESHILFARKSGCVYAWIPDKEDPDNIYNWHCITHTTEVI